MFGERFADASEESTGPLRPVLPGEFDVIRVLHVRSEGHQTEDVVVRKEVRHAAHSEGCRIRFRRVANGRGHGKLARGQLKGQQLLERVSDVVVAACRNANDPAGVHEVSQPDKAIAACPVDTSWEVVLVDAVFGRTATESVMGFW